MAERKKPTPRDVTYTGDRVRMTDTAQERVEDVVADLDDGSLLISVADGRASMSTQMWDRMVEEIARLRARQREEGDDEFVRGLRAGVRWIRNLPDDEDLERACEVIESRPEVQAEIKRLNDATPQREDDRLVPEACPHCSGLMGHYGDCPHAPQRERGREPVAWEERLAAALASALASAELVRRRGNQPDWWRCVACWEEGRGPGRIEHEPDCPEAVYAAWKSDTDPPVERDRA